MNKYVKFIILAVVIVLAFVGVKLVYDNLIEDYKPESGLVVENTSQSKAEETVDDNTTGQGATQADDGPVVDTRENQQVMEDSSQSEDETKAIDFTVEDIDGNKISLYSKVGKPIVVNFWASWCSPCKTELPDFQLAYESYGEDVEFMMVNLTDGRSETVEGAAGFINAQGYTFPVYYDVDQQAAYAYYVTSIPTTYFIDGEGNMVAYAQGMIDYNTLVKGISMIK